MKILSNESYQILRDEVTYWRERFEKEQERADRLQDNMLQSQGMLPISQAGVAKEDERAKVVEGMKEQLKELYETEVGELLMTDEEKELVKQLEAN